MAEDDTRDRSLRSCADLRSRAEGEERVDVIVLANETGVWAALSDEPAVIYLDLDHQALLRCSVTGCAPMPGDGRWVPLVQVERYLHREIGVVKRGERHRYVYDHDPGGTDYSWWVQPPVIEIRSVSADALSQLPTRLSASMTGAVHDAPPSALRASYVVAVRRSTRSSALGQTRA
jgi:hypothetical protein